MLAALVVGAFVIGVIAFELVRMWWRQNAWRRQWRDRETPAPPRRDADDS
jgi:hypothetical protein